jgi:RimJ/RimL family protein N-acetyltransferase
MEKLLHQRLPSRRKTITAIRVEPAVIAGGSDWKTGLPVIAGPTFTLREFRFDDAGSLMSMLTAGEVARFISPPPSSIPGFERFVSWTHAERAAGRCINFAVVPHGMDTAVGLFQVRFFEPSLATAEWGAAIGSEFWGSGIFAEGARLVLDFAFDVVGANRLEARAAVANGRGNAALRKLGAVQEGVLRQSFLRHGQYHDQVLWGILADEWRAQRSCADVSLTTH